MISGTLNFQHSVEVPEHGGISSNDLANLNQNSVSHADGALGDEQPKKYVIPEEEEAEEEADTLDVGADQDHLDNNHQQK